MVEGTKSANEIMWDLQATIFELRLTGAEIGILSDALGAWSLTHTDNMEQGMVRRIGRKLYEIVR